MITDIAVKPAGTKGKGVFALRDFKKGEFIFRRRHGFTVRNEDIPALSEEDQIHLCELDRNTSAVLLPPGCYLNHSCDPNAMRSGVKVFAWKEILKGDEITIDYRLNAFTGERWPCSCGSPNCPGYVLSDFFSLDESTQRAYLPYAPRFIRAQNRRHPPDTHSHA
ncbi:MAG: SET domain-containing protein [Chloroflexia bacterium]